jgi:hypothetical protein
MALPVNQDGRNRSRPKLDKDVLEQHQNGGRKL